MKTTIIIMLAVFLISNTGLILWATRNYYKSLGKEAKQNEQTNANIIAKNLVRITNQQIEIEMLNENIKTLKANDHAAIEAEVNAYRIFATLHPVEAYHTNKARFNEFMTSEGYTLTDDQVAQLIAQVEEDERILA